jgi:pimeloyl-ACP methyl ester carboxylesterase
MVKQQQPSLPGTSFEIDNMTFSHNTASVNGIQLHYVIGGQGDPVVLIHGWPETWYEWRHVMLGGEVLEYAKDNIAHCVSSTGMYGIRSS